jgi:methyl-accepting chemotaxis protein
LHAVHRRLATAALVLALAGVAAGCGGDDSSEENSTAAWADSFCSAITGWTDDLEGVTSAFSDASDLSQDGLQSAAEDVRTSTEQLVDELRDLGAPPTESGDEIRSALDSLSTTLETQTSEIEEAADGVSNLTDLPGAITTMTSSLSTMATAFSSALTTIQGADVEGEVEAALADSPECAGISSD